MYSYKYNFASKGVIATYKNIMAYILCISVVDHKDVTLDELIYLASEFAGDGAVGAGAGFQAYLEMLMKTWNALKIVDEQLANRAGAAIKAIDYPSLVTAAPTVIGSHA